MDQQKLDSILSIVEELKANFETHEETTKESMQDLSDRLTKVEKYLDNRHYLWDTVGKILAGLASGGAVTIALLKVFGVF